MTKEYLDIFDEKHNLVGIEERTEVHHRGLWHQTFQCWIVNQSAEGIYVMFQKRHPQKDTCPNLYDISSAGHLSQGENPEDGVRELKEELGIDVKFEDLIPIGILKQEIRGDLYTDREHCHVYIYISNSSLEDYAIQLEELVGLVNISLDDLTKLFNGEIGSVHASGYEIIESGERIQISKQLSEKDFVPHGKEYYTKVFQGIKSVIR